MWSVVFEASFFSPQSCDGKRVYQKIWPPSRPSHILVNSATAEKATKKAKAQHENKLCDTVSHCETRRMVPEMLANNLQ